MWKEHTRYEFADFNESIDDFSTTIEYEKSKEGPPHGLKVAPNRRVVTDEDSYMMEGWVWWEWAFQDEYGRNYVLIIIPLTVGSSSCYDREICDFDDDTRCFVKKIRRIKNLPKRII